MPSYDEVLTETLSLWQSTLVNGHYTIGDSIDSASISDAMAQGLVFSDTLVESPSITDVIIQGYGMILLDTLTSLDIIRDFGATVWLAENASLFDQDQIGYGKLLSDSITLTDATVDGLTILLLDWIGLYDAIIVTGAQSIISYDSFGAYDIVEQGKAFLDTLVEAITATDVVSRLVELNNDLLEAISILDTSSLAGSAYYNVLVDILSITDELIRSFDFNLTEAIPTVDSNIAIVAMRNILVDSSITSDITTTIYNLMMSLVDAANMTDNNSTLMAMISTLIESIIIREDIYFDGEVWECFAINGDDFLPSVFSGINFNGLCSKDNIIYGCSDTGVYKMNGVQDGGKDFHTGVRLEYHNFGIQNVKRFRSAHFGISGSNIMLKVSGEANPQFYRVNNRSSAIGRDVRGKEIVFEIANPNEVNFVELVPVILTRRSV